MYRNYSFPAESLIFIVCTDSNTTSAMFFPPLPLPTRRVILSAHHAFIRSSLCLTVVIKATMKPYAADPVKTELVTYSKRGLNNPGSIMPSTPETAKWNCFTHFIAIRVCVQYGFDVKALSRDTIMKIWRLNSDKQKHTWCTIFIHHLKSLAVFFTILHWP